MLKIIIMQPNNCSKEFYLKNYKRISNDEYKFTLFFVTDFVEEPILTAKQLDDLYRNKDPRLSKMYKVFKEFSSDADAVIAMAYNTLHPDYILSKLQDVYTVLLTCDDPPASYNRTVPYAYAFNHAFCTSPVYGVNGASFPKKLRQWGFINASWIPIMSFSYNPKMREEDILNKERKIDILYVGKLYSEKIDNLIKLKKIFGKKVRIYGFWKYWGFQGMLHTLYRRKPLFWWRVKSLSEREFIKTYCNSKIGINMHLENNNIGNLRMYHLALNGVMQICDLGPKNALNEIYEVGREVVGYKTFDEAIELIRHYLKHEDERKKIAAAGFSRARKDYTPEAISKRWVEEIKKGILRAGIYFSKDGNKIV